jgi:diguanylate cyclase (GGDEF)-like protein
MTDLYNRNYFEEVRSRLDNSKNVYTLVMFDLDGLKNINDILGHNEGDEYLKDFASRLREIADDNYYIPIRMGGDEFLLICLNKNKASITQRLKSFCAMNPNDEREIIFSYGVAERERDDELLETVFNRADDLMYEMKNSNIELKNSMKQKLIDSIK